MTVNDVALLPSRLARASLSDTEIVLPHPEVLDAIDSLASKGHAVFCWEGWLRYADGSRGHSARHQGIREISLSEGEDFADFIRRAATAVLSTISKAQEEWNRNREVAGAMLCFCLSVEQAQTSHPNGRKKGRHLFASRERRGEPPQAA